MQPPDSRTDHVQRPAGGEDRSPAAKGRFSLHRLSAAFARLTGDDVPVRSTSADTVRIDDEPHTERSVPVVGNVLSPRRIVEGMLFVGASDGRPLTSRAMAASIRDVSPSEVDALIQQLNEIYQQSDTAYEIVSEGAGYHMRVRPKLDAIRQRFGGRVREAKLTPPAIEVLSVVAYRQPVTAEEVSQLRGARSHALLSQLLRRGLLRLERPDKAPRKPTYHTTERFNRLFRVDSPADLPSSEDLDDG